jgi:hypothetical protein
MLKPYFSSLTSDECAATQVANTVNLNGGNNCMHKMYKRSKQKLEYILIS